MGAFLKKKLRVYHGLEFDVWSEVLLSQEISSIVGVRDHGVGIFSMSSFDGDMDGIQGKNTKRFLMFFSKFSKTTIMCLLEPGLGIRC